MYLKDKLTLIGLAFGAIAMFVYWGFIESREPVSATGTLQQYECRYFGGKGKEFIHEFLIEGDEYTFTSKAACEKFSRPVVGNQYRFSYFERLQGASNIVFFEDVISQAQGEKEVERTKLAIALMALMFTLLFCVKLCKVKAGAG
ncbi:hypothetical protein L1285_10720 [Pseudoalteromonas sp. DL2-H2.2]|uniref:hypothetical protein n=1 Tax=Pseudoalteromonas sp. DL2-H2.2 TaxID=2908889 RepID=UPI001F44B931|nr:hypothetical protein [Pseudoalteromonas sp. DL2-H2.2]MCF2908791.1 hypothetical protein [Pseudoalteromonas sp. DL2-H2.2]